LQLNNIVYKDLEVTNLFNRFDINKDGIVSLREFKILLTPRKLSVVTPPELFEKEELSDIEITNKDKNSRPVSSSHMNSFNTLSMSERLEINKDLCSLDKNPIFLPSFRNIRNCNLEEEMFYTFLRDLIRRYKMVDDMRNKLIKRYDFNLTDIFMNFTKASKKTSKPLKIEDFKNAINGFGIYPTDNELILFFKRFAGKRGTIE
jgi:hypothetical protein